MARKIHISSLLPGKNSNKRPEFLNALLTIIASREPARPVLGNTAQPGVILDELKGLGAFNPNKLTLLNFNFISDLNLSWEQPSSVC